MRQSLLLCVNPHRCPVWLFTAGSCLALKAFPAVMRISVCSCRVFRVVLTSQGWSSFTGVNKDHELFFRPDGNSSRTHLALPFT